MKVIAKVVSPLDGVLTCVGVVVTASCIFKSFPAPASANDNDEPSVFKNLPELPD